MDSTRRFVRLIRLGFFGAGILAILVGVAALFTLRESVQTRNHLISERIEPMIIAQEMVAALERKVAASRGYVIAPEQISAQEVWDNHWEFQNLLNELRENPGVARPEQLAVIGQGEQQHQSLLDRGFELRRRGESLPNIIRYWQLTIIPLHRTLRANLIQVLDQNRQAFEAASVSSASRSSRGVVTMAIVVGIASVLILLLVPLVTRMLSENLRVSEELQRAHDELRRANEQLEQRVQERTVALSAANQELEAFSYSVSHDLRAPLRGIDGFSQALLEDCSAQLDAQGREYLQRIRSGVQRMGRLIDDLLSLSRLTRREIHFQAVNLTAIARSVLEELRAADAERNVHVEIGEVGQVTGDAGLLSAALENLFTNAWKFTSKKPDARIEFGAFTQKDAHGLAERVYFVRDNGAGFDMAYSDKLFGAFQRLHGVSEFGGTGIGLATVRRIIHRHGGRIWAAGEVGKGATFYFTLGAREVSLQAA